MIAYVHTCQKCKIIYKSYSENTPCPKCNNSCYSETSLKGECPMMFHSCFEFGTECIYKTGKE